MSTTSHALLNFVETWLKNKGCSIAEVGVISDRDDSNWEVTGSTDRVNVFVLDEDIDFPPEICVSLQSDDSSVYLHTRLWYDRMINIESRKATKVSSEKEVIAALTILHETLCQVNELVAHFRNPEL